jgi:hypothetical protein
MDQRTTLETISELHPCAPLLPPLNGIPNQQILRLDIQTMVDVTRDPHSLNAFSCAISGQPPATLAALLDQIARRTGVPASMLRTITAHLARYIGAPVTDLKLGFWDAELPSFAAYLVN